MKVCIPDLGYEVQGDLIRLEQSSGMDDSVVIDLHRLHLAHLAEVMGVQRRPDLERRIEQLGDAMLDVRNGIGRLANLLDSVPCFPPGPMTEDVRIAFDLLDRADRYLDDFDIAEPLGGEEGTGEARERSAMPATAGETARALSAQGKPHGGPDKPLADELGQQMSFADGEGFRKEHQ